MNAELRERSEAIRAYRVIWAPLEFGSLLWRHEQTAGYGAQPANDPPASLDKFEYAKSKIWILT